MVKFLAGLVLGFLAAVQGLPILPTSQHYNQSLQLDAEGKYTVYWAFNKTHITFEVHVQTWGYVGFGLSPNGNMYPADVVIGWVKDGKTFFADRHTTAHAPPVVDKKQDWFLLHGEENDFGTILKFVRKLDTCDNEDKRIDDQTVRLIYSYHPDDPVSETSLMYHGAERRGTKSISLLSSSLPPPSFEHEDFKVFDFRTRNYLVPDKDTTYLCSGFELPDLGGKHHMVEFEPIYTPGMEHFVHHIVVLKCNGSHPEYDMKIGECLGEWPKGWPICTETFIVWATGGGPFYYPENTGVSMGDKDDATFYVMQTHYNNPMHKSGMIDSSGIRMKLTSRLRQHDVREFGIAVPINTHQVIPPKERNFISRAICVEECTNNAQTDNDEDIKVVAGFLHAHLLGRGITLRHFRKGIEIEPLMDDPNYDFFFQEIRPLNRTIKKGDSFILECTYNSMERSEASFGGFSTREEMCGAALWFYPNSTLRACTSQPLYDTYNVKANITNDDLKQKFLHLDWQDQSVRQDFYQKLATSNVTHKCIYNSNNHFTVDKYTFVDKIAPMNRTDTSKSCQAAGH